ncbi:hypothetical protein RQM65_04860 [Pricia sp. S334]|uniref:YopA central domain-containing protein n=1 Tax=Pricia mediterranea TaxID=3076079 RepID=A0ABU3L412_9FLAO|nr:hypothetical protein [Pricia sp. S334]MDT7827993.1 hypothetical protein [Pricia sp. S334]
MLTQKEFENIPIALEESTAMSVPNEPIEIFEGAFNFKLDETDRLHAANGRLEIVWQPTIRIKLFCEYESSESIGFHDLFLAEYIFLKMDSEIFYKCFITKSSSNKRLIQGELMETPFFGNIDANIDHVLFDVPNLRKFHGDIVKRELDGGLSSTSSRLVLTNKKFITILEMRHSFDSLSETLRNEGGYLFLHNGLIKKKRNNQLMTHEDLKNQIQCLDFFLSFFNGRAVCAMFLKGKVGHQKVWEDYQYLNTENYRSSFSWAPTNIKSKHLQSLWSSFCKIWNYREDSSFLTFAVKWYNEANMNEVSTDTRLIMAQTTLELIYNWWLIEKNQLITINDANNLAAENKIRLVLAQIGISYEIPVEFTGLILQKKKQVFKDGPNSIVYIRNSLVHSNTNKIKGVTNLPPETRGEAVILANWYIELALLKILDYNGKYQKRMGGVELVPWVNT